MKNIAPFETGDSNALDKFNRMQTRRTTGLAVRRLAGTATARREPKERFVLPVALALALFLSLVLGHPARAAICDVIRSAGVTASQTTLEESGVASAQLIFTRDWTTSASSLTLAVSGSAANGADYMALPSQVDFPSGVSRVVLDVIPIPDAEVEGTETLTVEITNPDGLCFSIAPRSVTLSIVEETSVSAYPEPPGGWTYLYDGATAAGAPRRSNQPALDGTWRHENNSSEWNGDGRGAANPPAGGVESVDGVLTIEDAVAATTGANNNRKFYFEHGLVQDGVFADNILDTGITLTFRTRLTPADGRNEIALPNGYGIFSDGKGMFVVRQANPGAAIAFSLVNATEDFDANVAPFTLSFPSAGLVMNKLNGDIPSTLVDANETVGTVNLLALDPTEWHEFWITIEANDTTPGNGTHTVHIYMDGSIAPTTFNVTAGTGADVDQSMPSWTSFLAMGLNNSPTVGAFDIDFFGYAPGVIPPIPPQGPPQIVSQPQAQSIVQGDTASFSVGVQGMPPLSFQWYFDEDLPIPDATDATLVISDVQWSDSGGYSVIVSNALGSVTSQVARLTVVTLADAVDTTNLVWTTGGNALWHPSPVTHDGEDAVQSGAIGHSQESWFQTAVTGPGTLFFWWKVSSEREFDWLRFDLDGVLQAQISGETDWEQRSFVLPIGSHVLRWRYVKDPGGIAGQDRSWVDEVVFLPASGHPWIVSAPVDQVAWQGARVSMSAVALGSPPLSHQWYFDETTLIAGATEATLTLSNVLPGDAGRYHVVVSNASGSVISSPAILALTNNGAVDRVLLFVDSPVTGPFVTALHNLGLGYQQFSSISLFNAAVAGADPASTLVIVDAPANLHDFDSFNSFIAGGGRVLLEANTLAGNPSLAALFEVAVEGRGPTPQPVSDWGGAPLFAGLSNSLNFVEIGLEEDVQRLHAVGDARAVAGFVAETAPGEAAVVIGNGGRTIVNGFWAAGISSTEAAIRFVENEILFLTGPVSATEPLIRVPPKNQTLLAGDPAALKVTAWGGPPLHYQWRKDGREITGATQSVYRIVTAQPTHAGAYTVVVSNSFSSVTSAPALLVVTPALPIETILLFVDSSYGVASPYEAALGNIGRPYQKFATVETFSTAIGAANPATTLLIIDSIDWSHDFSSVVQFVNARGRAILQYWNLSASSSLAGAFNASAAEAIYVPPPVYDWGGSPFFAGLSSPISFIDQFALDGQRLQPTAGGQAVAGFSSMPSLNEAAVIIGNSGRTIVNGLALEETAVKANGIQLAQNEIEYLLALRTVQLSAPAWVGGQFQVMLAGNTGLTYSLRRTTDFVNWTTVTNVTLTANPMLIPLSVSADRNFFQAVTPPVP